MEMCLYPENDLPTADFRVCTTFYIYKGLDSSSEVPLFPQRKRRNIKIKEKLYKGVSRVKFVVLSAEVQ